MDNNDFTKVVMNPVRQRIVQYLIMHEKGTPGEIKESLTDVPTASLYRHIKVLYDAKCIEVVEEKKVRGTIEKTYALSKQPFDKEPTTADISALIQNSLMSLQGSFLKYFAEAEKDKSMDPAKDMLLLQTSTLMLSDEEYVKLLQGIGEVISGVIQNEPNKDRKMRRFTIISSPKEK